MAKTILKEAGIVLLLLVAIALILGIILYDYIPNNKTIPAKVEKYTFPEDVKEELSKSLKNEEQNIVRTFYIDSQDLSLYESTKDYNKGKANPFAPATTVVTNKSTNTTSAGSNSTSSNKTSSSANTSKIEDATNTSEFLNNKTGKY